MYGKIDIYQGYMDNGEQKISDTPLYSNHNMIVDGAKEHIVDIMTRIPAPTSIVSAVSGAYEASNFTVRAMTLAPNESGFLHNHALKAASGFIFPSATPGTATYSSLDPSGNLSWVMKPDINNFSLTAVNSDPIVYPTSKSQNSRLRNSTFSSVSDSLENSTYQSFYLNNDVTGAHLNEQLYLYELPHWEMHNPLVYYNTNVSYNHNVAGYGAISRYPVNEVQAIFNLETQPPSLSGNVPDFSGTFIFSGYSNEDDGVLVARSWGASSEGTPASGLSYLYQTFSLKDPESAALPKEESDESLDLVAEITAKFSCFQGTGNSNIQITLQDLTEGDSYVFDTSGAYDRHSWEVCKSTSLIPGVPLITPATANTSGTISHFVNIPNARRGHDFRLSFFFFSNGAADLLQTFFWDAGIKTIDSWEFGHIYKNDTVSRIWNNNFTAPQFFMTTEGAGYSGGETFAELPLSSTTYISQLFNMKPLKKYSFNICTRKSDMNAPGPADQFLDIGVIKRRSGPTEGTDYNFLTDVRAASLVDSRLINSTAHPFLWDGGLSSVSEWGEMKVKPADLCLVVSADTTTVQSQYPSLAGTFTVSASTNEYTGRRGAVNSRTGVISGKVLKKYKSRNVIITVRSLKAAPGVNRGGYYYWDFNNRTWVEDLYEYWAELGPASEGIWFDTSTVYASDEDGYAYFKTDSIDSSFLISNGYTEGVVLEIYNKNNSEGFALSGVRDDIPAFMKGLRYDGIPIAIEDARLEYFNWDADAVPTSCWMETSTHGGQYAFSGISTVSHTDDFNGAAATWGSGGNYAFQPIANMCQASASIHTDQAIYQCIIGNTRNEGTIGIGGTFFYDAALGAVTGEVSEDEYTSESYSRTPSFGIEGQPVLQFYDTINTDTSIQTLFDGVYPGAHINTPAHQSVLFDYKNGISLGTLSGVEPRAQMPACDLSYTFTYDELLQTAPSSNGIGFTFTFQQMEDALVGNPLVTWFAVAELEDGGTLYYNHTTQSWEEVQQYTLSPDVVGSFNYVARRGSVNGHRPKTIRGGPCYFKDARFTPKTKIKFSIRQTLFGNFGIMWIKDWSFYNTMPYVSKDLGAMPSPVDTTVQPITLPAGAQGHYTNDLQFYEDLSSVTISRALANCTYAPDEPDWGIVTNTVVSGINIDSTLNRFGCVNSDGYIHAALTGPVDIGGQDWYLSGFVPTPVDLGGGASGVRFTVDVSGDDLMYLEAQGGIGGIGLHTFNTLESYKKLLDGGYALSAIYEAGTGEKLYNFEDVARNPVFKLFAKKVFRTPLPIRLLTGSGNFIRIQWDIRLF